MDKARLFEPRLPEAEVDVPGVGTVRVRALTRGEVFQIQKGTDVADIERKILATGMVDPELSQSDVRKWQDASTAAEIEPVVVKIHELSGLSDDAEKAAMLDFRGEPSDGVRVVPGAEVEHDGGDAARADVA